MKFIDKNKDTSENSEWKEILLIIYKFSPNQYGWGNKGFTKDHNLVKKSKIDPKNVMLSISFLEENNLIYSPNKNTNLFSITEKGFNVAFELEKQLLSASINLTMIIFTALLVFSALVNLVLSFRNDLLVLTVVGIIVVLISLVYVHMIKKLR
jgi:hypothetical protein